MTLKQKITPIAAAALAASAFSVPMTANAEVSASMAFSNMYLWRGQNLSPDGSVISGSLDFSHESGGYAGIWTSSENEGHETDIYFGFAGAAGDISYDVSYWWYLYPEDDGPDGGDGLGDSDVSELVGSIGVGPVTFTLHMGIDTEAVAAPGDGLLDDDYFYYALNYSANQFSLTFGGWSWDESDGSDYTHLTLGYSPLEELSFAVSIAQEDGKDTIEENPLYQVTYSKGFDLHKM